VIRNEKSVVSSRFGGNPQAVAAVDDGGQPAFRPSPAEQAADAFFQPLRPLFFPHASGDDDHRAGLPEVHDLLHDVVALLRGERQDEHVDRSRQVADGWDAAAALDFGESRFDDEDVLPRESVFQDVIENDMTDIHSLGYADDADRFRLKQPADLAAGPPDRFHLFPGKTAHAVEGDETA